MNKCSFHYNQLISACQNVKNVGFFLKNTIWVIIYSPISGKIKYILKNGGSLSLAKEKVNCHSNINLQNRQ